MGLQLQGALNRKPCSLSGTFICTEIGSLWILELCRSYNKFSLIVTASLAGIYDDFTEKSTDTQRPVLRGHWLFLVWERGLLNH